MAWVNTLTIAGHVSSPVTLSDSPMFKRKFSSMYDTLVFGDLGDELRTVFSNSQDENWETIAGYDVHAADATSNERIVAEVPEYRCALKASQKEPVRHSRKYSWLVRLVQSGTSSGLIKNYSLSKYRIHIGAHLFSVTGLLWPLSN